MSTSTTRVKALRERRVSAGLCLTCARPMPVLEGDHGRTAATVDDQTLRYALQSILKGQLALASWRAMPNTFPRSARENAKAAALAQIAHGQRFLDELMDRHGFTI